MPQIAEDFTGLTPSTGSSWGDYVPPGIYSFTVSGYSDAPTRNGHEQHSFTLGITEGQYAGLTIKDNFVKTEGSDVAQRRMMGFLLALGLPIQAGKMKLDSAKLIGQSAQVVVRDRIIEARDSYPAKTVTNVVGYRDTEGREPGDIFIALRAKGSAPQAAPTPPATPAPAAPPVAATVEAAPPSNGSKPSVDDVTADVDSMFS